MDGIHKQRKIEGFYKEFRSWDYFGQGCRSMWERSLRGWMWNWTKIKFSCYSLIKHWLLLLKAIFLWRSNEDI